MVDDVVFFIGYSYHTATTGIVGGEREVDGAVLLAGPVGEILREEGSMDGSG